ncbi:hypothetical protein AAV99_04735 [Aurantiacibacter marinus]|uniref:Biopolymer transporter ExbD n=1 Tax=Aurantiacibacter marinus TaxID=874156 RepID=A0A0H0XX17_9SPHN|nr:hypothetical protein AAV99_04735 [Aurantiacibacter marinus]
MAAIWLISATMVMAVYTNPAHAILVDLPLPTMSGDLGSLSTVGNRLSIARDGTLYWNSQLVSEGELSKLLDQTMVEFPQPALWFEPDGDASYESAAHVLALLREKQLLDRCFRFSNAPLYRQYESPQPSELPTFQRRDCDMPSGY